MGKLTFKGVVENVSEKIMFIDAGFLGESYSSGACRLGSILCISIQNDDGVLNIVLNLDDFENANDDWTFQKGSLKIN